MMTAKQLKAENTALRKRLFDLQMQRVVDALNSQPRDKDGVLIWSKPISEVSK